MSELSWAAIVRLVHDRARNCCEYCQTRQATIGQALHVEHIDPRGGNDLENLCLACPTCNLSKATATAGLDPETKETVTLFNPRTQNWREHFRWIDGGRRVQGLTPTGRATVERLRMNQDRVIVARALWVKANWHPPTLDD
jgi:hypothetical protein